MKEIIKKWCETHQLSLEEAMEVLTEYYKLDDRSPTGQDLMALIQLSQQHGFPINWPDIFTKICVKNNWNFASVQKIEGPMIQTLYYYIW